MHESLAEKLTQLKSVVFRRRVERAAFLAGVCPARSIL